ncbi:ABC transporter permease [Brevibacillus sp. B_LB10_24]|uniref:ABC transporter permease n=1 Tax=Brevibacillus sp. B_LB10_24 TaxID=3380645 RepID=UPI0038BC7781
MLQKISDRLGIGVAIIVLFLLLSFSSPYFLDVTNLMNILLQVSISSILAVGMTFVIITAGIDLSVGPLTALSSVILGLTLSSGWGVGLPLVFCILMGAVLGLINGVIIAKFRVPAFIATLGMMSIARGTALYITNGQTIHMFPETFVTISAGSIGFIPLPVIYALAVAIIASFILNYTKFGRYVYALGGNKEAVRLSGINTMKIEIWVYVISGICSGLGAIILAGRLNAAQPIAGVGYELDAIAAVIIGGTSLSGGEGKISGTIMGAILIGMLKNGLNLLNVSPFLQQIIIGAVIIGAVFYDQFRRAKKDLAGNN